MFSLGPVQVPLSMEFSRPEYWSRWLFSSPGDLPYPAIELLSPALQTDSLLSEPPGEALMFLSETKSPTSSMFTIL